MDNLTAFEVERKMIEKRVKDSSISTPHGTDNLITDLERVFQEKQRNTKDANKAGEIGFCNTDEKKGNRTNNRKCKKQFKGTCNKCGKIGHKACECRSETNHDKSKPDKGKMKKKFPGKCCNCGLHGHKRQDCRKKAKEDSGHAAKSEIACSSVLNMRDQTQ